MSAHRVFLRRCASWQIEPDDRLLEALRVEGWTSPGTLAAKPAIRLTRRQIRARLRLLADAELVAPHDRDYDLYHLTTEGELYLDGQRDQQLHPHPRSCGLATAVTRR